MIQILNNTEKEIDIDFFNQKVKELSETLNIKGDITIKIGTLKESHNLNLTYRKKDSPTDVLSFQLNEYLPDNNFYIGDILICLEISQNQARENSISLQEELLRLMIHGILHLLGYEHSDDNDEMLMIQEELLRKLS